MQCITKNPVFKDNNAIYLLTHKSQYLSQSHIISNMSQQEMQTLLKMQKDREQVLNAPKSRKECRNRINAYSSNSELSAGVIREIAHYTSNNNLNGCILYARHCSNYI